MDNQKLIKLHKIIKKNTCKSFTFEASVIFEKNYVHYLRASKKII